MLAWAWFLLNIIDAIPSGNWEVKDGCLWACGYSHDARGQEEPAGWIHDAFRADVPLNLVL